MTKNKTEKIYCYVDETGQDTGGKLFIVVSIIVGEEKASLEIFLDACELKSGRLKRKWLKTRKKEKGLYVGLALTPALLKERIYYRKCDSGKNYIGMTAETIVAAINDHMQRHKTVDGSAHIVIDGLNAKEKSAITRIIRGRKFAVKKIRGMRDQSSSLIRLADTVAGMLRDASEGSREWQPIVTKLKKEGVLDEI